MRDLVDIAGDAESWTGREVSDAECIANLSKALADVAAERDRANDALKLYRADRDFAHRLAVMLECVLLGGKGTWDAGHALLDEYREACRIESNECPACMGEPVTDVRAHVRTECQHCGGFGEVTGECPGVACQICNGTGLLTPNNISTTPTPHNSGA